MDVIIRFWIRLLNQVNKTVRSVNGIRSNIGDKKMAIPEDIATFGTLYGLEKIYFPKRSLISTGISVGFLATGTPASSNALIL